MLKKCKDVFAGPVQISTLSLSLARVAALPEEGNTPLLHRARRLVDADQPMLQDYCTQEEWAKLSRVLRGLLVARDEASMLEEYHSAPWLCLREQYRRAQCPRDSRICYVRQASFSIPAKA